MARHTNPGLALQPVAQFSLFEVERDQDPCTNQVELYDLAPRCVFYTTEKERVGPYLKTVERNFTHAGKGYKLVLYPARVRRPDGTELDVYPSEREQIVEEVLRRLASEANRIWLEEDERQRDRVMMAFTVNEIRTELKRVGHSLNGDQVREALEVLHRSIIEIRQCGAGKDPLLSSSAFPVMMISDARNSGAKTYLQFNPLVAQAIRSLDWRRASYETLMRISDPVARWLYKRLALRTRPNDANIVMRATTIAQDSGLVNRSRMRDTLKRITEAMDSLVDARVLDGYSSSVEKEGRRQADILYDLTLSTSMRDELLRADRAAIEARRTMKRIAGTEQPDKFLRVDPDRLHKVRQDERLALSRT